MGECRCKQCSVTYEISTESLFALLAGKSLIVPTFEDNSERLFGNGYLPYDAWREDDCIGRIPVSGLYRLVAGCAATSENTSVCPFRSGVGKSKNFERPMRSETCRLKISTVKISSRWNPKWADEITDDPLPRMPMAGLQLKPAIFFGRSNGRSGR